MGYLAFCLNSELVATSVSPYDVCKKKEKKRKKKEKNKKKSYVTCELYQIQHFEVY